MSKPIIIKAFVRNASAAYKKKKMLESKLKREIVWSDFLNICIDQLYTNCSVCGTKQEPSNRYLNNYEFYERKDVINKQVETNNNNVNDLEEVKKDETNIQSENLTSEKKEINE